MTKNEKRAAIITGTLLFAVAAFFSISVILGILDFGSISRGTNFAYRFGFMLVSVYGVSSLFIPAFFFVAGCFCFDAHWSLQKMLCLLVSVIPFFTLAFAERTARSIASSDSSPIAAVKITVLLVIAILLVAAEYLVTLVIAGVLQKKLARENAALQTADDSDEAYDEEDFSEEDYEEEEEEENSTLPIEEEHDEAEKTQDPIEAELDKKIADAVQDESAWSLADILSKNRKSIEKTVGAQETTAPQTEQSIPKETPAPVPEASPLQSTEAFTKETYVQEEIAEHAAEKTEETADAKEEPIAQEANTEPQMDYLSDPWNVTTKKPKPEKKSETVETVETAETAEIAEIAEKAEDAGHSEHFSEHSAEHFSRTSADQPPEQPAEQNAPQKKTITDDDPWNVTKKLVERARVLEEKERQQSHDKALDEADSIAENADFEEDDIIAEFERGSVNLEEDEELLSFEDVTDRSAEEDSLPNEMEEMFEEPEEPFIDIPDEMEFESELKAEEEIPEPEEVLLEEEEEMLPQAEELPAEEEIPEAEKKTQTDSSRSMLSALDSVFARMDADVKANFDPTAPAVVDSNGVLKSEPPESPKEEKPNTSAAEKKEIKEPVKAAPPKPKARHHGPYKIPTELLTAYDANPYWIIDEETTAAAENLKNTLKEFKIDAEVTGIKKGPVVTMFEILPAPGVKLSKIVALQDNIALRLAASSVRIVAPIPGKHAVGIEVPNKNRAIISMRECIELERPEWKKMAVPVVLGKDIQGEAQIIDLAKTPHLLIAGSTGAGKSVCVNSMILSILYKRGPNEVKMILIDPKIVELKLYNDIPHLLTPVITEPKRAMQALQYCLCEMERRYALLDHMSVRDISSYNKKIVEKGVIAEKLPYLIVVIDEFADLMATTGKQLEGVLARLAAMSRAVGIHLVLATQRPSIDVITGLIKANIPSRIAFMVAGKMDSRIIIDQVGAEKLLGKGDMLYASATDPFPVRIQGTFVSDQEVEDVVSQVKEWGEPEYIDDEIFVDDDEDGDGEQMSLFSPDGEDPLYDKALEIVVQTGKASASYIQRKLKIGYNRAARLVEEMEERGIVGPANGSKPRELIHIP